jgi:hypothetical protein
MRCSNKAEREMFFHAGLVFIKMPQDKAKYACSQALLDQCGKRAGQCTKRADENQDLFSLALFNPAPGETGCCFFYSIALSSLPLPSN